MTELVTLKYDIEKDIHPCLKTVTDPKVLLKDLDNIYAIPADKYTMLNASHQFNISCGSDVYLTDIFIRLIELKYNLKKRDFTKFLKYILDCKHIHVAIKGYANYINWPSNPKLNKKFRKVMNYLFDTYQIMQTNMIRLLQNASFCNIHYFRINELLDFFCKKKLFDHTNKKIWKELAGSNKMVVCQAIIRYDMAINEYIFKRCWSYQLFKNLQDVDYIIKKLNNRLSEDFIIGVSNHDYSLTNMTDREEIIYHLFKYCDIITEKTWIHMLYKYDVKVSNIVERMLNDNKLTPNHIKDIITSFFVNSKYKNISIKLRQKRENVMDIFKKYNVKLDADSVNLIIEHFRYVYPPSVTLDIDKLFHDYKSEPNDNTILSLLRSQISLPAFKRYITKYDLTPNKIWLDHAIKHHSFEVIISILDFKIEIDINTFYNFINHTKNIYNDQKSKVLDVILRSNIELGIDEFEALIQKGYAPDIDRFNINFDEANGERFYHIIWSQEDHDIYSKYSRYCKVNPLKIQLREMFKKNNLNNIKEFIKNNNLPIDRYCFENAVNRYSDIRKNDDIIQFIIESGCDATPRIITKFLHKYTNKNIKTYPIYSNIVKVLCETENDYKYMSEEFPANLKI